MILSADVVGYCRLMAQDDVKTVRSLFAARQTINLCVRRHGGAVVDAVGDNMLIEFPDETRAFRCAIQVQQALAQFNQHRAEAEQLRLRIGLHAGDVIDARGALYGTTVNIVSRLEATADPGGICLSRRVAERIEIKGGLAGILVYAGAQQLKHIPDRVPAFRVRDPGAVSLRD